MPASERLRGTLESRLPRCSLANDVQIHAAIPPSVGSIEDWPIRRGEEVHRTATARHEKLLRSTPSAMSGKSVAVEVANAFGRARETCFHELLGARLSSNALREHPRAR